jgi:DNA helicase-2/ATP-dependent DNA helicase PcrA
VEELAGAGSGFREITLRRDYRTQSDSLRALFADARQILTDASPDETEAYHATRVAIETAADAAVGPPASQYIGPADGSTFLLFRSRAEVTAAANDLLHAGRDFRMRLPRGLELVEPWVAAVIGVYESPTFSRRAFESRLQALSPIPIAPQDELWANLRRVASDSGASIDLRKLSEVVASPSPPPEITRTDIGSQRGPLLSTIHAAKGREADTVHLMMPRVPERPDTDWLEEARILFVGATRARRRLRVGSAPSWLRRVSPTKPRLWQRFTRYGRRDALVEVGLESDVDVPALMDPAIWGSADAVWEIQQRLWRRSSGVSKLRAVRVGDVYDLQLDDGPDEGAPVGRLSRQFTSDLWTIGEFSCDARVPPPSTIRGIYMVSTNTVTSEPNASTGYRFWLAPVLAGVPLCHFDRSR